MATKEEWTAPFPISWKDVTEMYEQDLNEHGLPEDLWTDPAETDYSDEDCS